MTPKTAREEAPGNGAAPHAEEPIPDDSVLAKPPALIEELRAKRAEISEEKRTEIEIPGYGGRLVARYKSIPWRELRKGVGKIQRESTDVAEAEVNLAANGLIRCCDTILVRDKDTGTLQPLHEAVSTFGDEPVRFDARLAEALEITATGPREIVRLTFGNQFALIDHYRQLEFWLKDTSEEDEEDF